MKATFRRFFTNRIARAAGFLGMVSVLIVVGEFGYKVLVGPTPVAWFSLFSMYQAVTLLFLAVLIEYLSRIADALEKPGALGVKEEGDAS